MEPARGQAQEGALQALRTEKPLSGEPLRASPRLLSSTPLLVPYRPGLTSSRGAKAASCLILVVWWWLHLRHSSTWLLTHCWGCAGAQGLGALLTTWFRCSRYWAGIGLL